MTLSLPVSVSLCFSICEMEPMRSPGSLCTRPFLAQCSGLCSEKAVLTLQRKGCWGHPNDSACPSPSLLLGSRYLLSPKMSLPALHPGKAP